MSGSERSTEKRSTLGVLAANRGLRLLWASQALSQSAIRMYQMALLWSLLSAAKGGDAGFTAAVFLVMGALPAVLLVKWIGRTVDRAPTRKLLALTNGAAAVLTGSAAVLAWQGVFSTPLVYASALLLAVTQALTDPSLNKALPSLVEGDELETGVALMASTQSLANFAGAIFGAVLVDRAGVAGVAALNALAYLAAMFMVLGIRVAPASEHALASGDAAADSAAGGWRLLDSLPLIRKVLVGFGFTNFFGTPVLVVLPVYVTQVFGGSATMLGVLEGFIWIGLLAGTFSSRLFHRMTNTVQLGAICLAGFAVALLIPGLLVNAYVYGACLFVAGFALGVNNVRFVAMFQQEVPDAIKGRFFALMGALISFAIPMAYLAFGLIVDAAGPMRSSLIQGIGVAALAVWFWKLSRSTGPVADVIPLRPASEGARS